MKVKICGLRTLEAAQTAERAGADFLGFIMVQKGIWIQDITKITADGTQGPPGGEA